MGETGDDVKEAGRFSDKSEIEKNGKKGSRQETTILSLNLKKTCERPINKLRTMQWALAIERGQRTSLKQSPHSLSDSDRIRVKIPSLAKLFVAFRFKNKCQK